MAHSRCDECGADVDNSDDMVNGDHADSCSLHPNNVSP